MQDLNIYNLLIYKASKHIRTEYKLTTHHILVLTACYVYVKHINNTFAPTTILKLLGYYFQKRFLFYFTGLVKCNMIALAGAPEKHYIITELGIKTIEQINSNTDSLVCSFCNKYNIVL
jgi:hypothetical protein